MRMLLTVGVVAVTACHLRLGTTHEPFSHAIDPSIKPSGPDVVAAVDGRGHQFEYAPDQLVVHPRDRASLDALVARYRGTIIVDGSQPHTLDAATMPATGYYLIKIDPAASTLDDLDSNGQRTNQEGRIRFSSEPAARLAALVVRERAAIDVGVNIAMHGNDFVNTKSVLENPNGSGGFVDYALKPYMQLAKVIKAWDYLEYKGIPFGPTPWRAPVIAIIDGGFALDGSGNPIGNNPDFDMARVRQLDETVAEADGHRHNAGGTNPASCTGGAGCPYHGNGTFSTAAAFPYNRFGGAGTSAEVAKLILIRANAGLVFQVSQAVSDAALMGADVINLSMGTGDCGSFCGYIAANTFTEFQVHVNFARGYSLSTVVASAGNSNENNSGQYDNVPCTLDAVVCVGATQNNNTTSESYSGHGSRVAIWAPDCIDVTPVPVNDTTLATTLGVFCGTSASAPFVSGIVALMKALQPTLDVSQVTSILQSTATASTDPLVTPGVVNALAALQQISPNKPPTIHITSHTNNQKVTINESQNFIASIADPELETNHIEGMTTTWQDSVQGALCVTNNCDAKLKSLGPHVITATVTDGWGAKATDTITLVVTAGPLPTANITWPDTNTTFSSSQSVELRGNGYATTEPVIPDARLAWASDRDGPLGTGSDRLVMLHAGTHHITLTATDSFGQTGSSTIVLNIIDSPDVPTAQILQPADWSGFGVNQSFDLVGKGTDPIDGDLPDANLTWSDDRGALGTGKRLTVKLPGPNCGPVLYTITLKVRNKAGKTSQTQIRVYIGPVC